LPVEKWREKTEENNTKKSVAKNPVSTNGGKHPCSEIRGVRDEKK